MGNVHFFVVGRECAYVVQRRKRITDECPRDREMLCGIFCQR